MSNKQKVIIYLLVGSWIGNVLVSFPLSRDIEMISVHWKHLLSILFCISYDSTEDIEDLLHLM